jgi:hypothetical protein
MMGEYDYMMALWSQFCPTWSEDEPSEKLYRKLRDMLPKHQRKELLRLVDSSNAHLEMVSLESFVAGFQLATGIARETTRSPYSFAEAEAARAGKQE